MKNNIHDYCKDCEEPGNPPGRMKSVTILGSGMPRGSKRGSLLGTIPVLRLSSVPLGVFRITSSILTAPDSSSNQYLHDEDRMFQQFKEKM
jgi:hypothetical protein